MNDIADMNYSEFTLLLDEDLSDRFHVIIGYDDFEIYIDTSTGRYFYLECGENDAGGFFEVECIAQLIYNTDHDLRIPHEDAGCRLSELFDCDMCGEHVDEDRIVYMWFAKKGATKCM